LVIEWAHSPVDGMSHLRKEEEEKEEEENVKAWVVLF